MTVIVREYNPDEVLPSSESNTENCTTCMSSQDYLEAMDSLQEKYNEFKAKEHKLQEKIEHMKKDFSSLYGLIRHCRASKLADEPELTINEYLVLIFLEKDFSKFRVSPARVSCLDFKTLIPFLISSFEKGSSING